MPPCEFPAPPWVRPKALKFCASQPSFSSHATTKIKHRNEQSTIKYSLKTYPQNRTNRPKRRKIDVTASLSHIHHLALVRVKKNKLYCMGIHGHSTPKYSETAHAHTTVAGHGSVLNKGQFPTWNPRFFLPASSWFLCSKAFLLDSDISIYFCIFLYVSLCFSMFLYVSLCFSICFCFLCLIFGQVTDQLRALLIFHQNGLSKGS